MLAQIPEEKNKVKFVPLHKSYRRQYAQIPDEITHENFGAIEKTEKGLGTRNDISDYINVLQSKDVRMKRSSIINGDKNLSPEPGPYNPSKHQR